MGLTLMIKKIKRLIIKSNKKAAKATLKPKIKVRNLHALNAIQMSKKKGGVESDKRKEQSKKACKKFKQTGEY